MRRLLPLLFLLSMLITPAAAYLVVIDAPRTLASGEPLIVNGTSTLPPGYTNDLILCSGSVELARTRIVIQHGGTFSARINTTGLAPNDYRVRVVPPRDPSFFGSSSVMDQLVTIVKRSEEVGATTSVPTKTPTTTPTKASTTIPTTTPTIPPGSVAPTHGGDIGGQSFLLENVLGAGSLILFVGIVFLQMRDSSK